MTHYNYFRWLGFGLVLVAALGDSYKISDYWPIGVPITIIIFASFFFSILKINQISVKNIMAIAIATLALIYGLNNNNLYFVLQDFLPIATSILLFVCLKSIDPMELVNKLTRYTRIFLIVALMKVCYIIIVKPPPDWGVTWMASFQITDGGFPRVMLKGASSLYFISVAFECINFLNNKKRSFMYLVLGFALIILDGSRALLAATLIPSFLVLASVFKFNIYTVLTKIIPIVTFFLAIIAFVTSASFRLGDPEISGEFEEVGVESVSAAYRLLEAYSAIESVQNVYIGNGLGASFFALASGAVSDTGEGVYVHSFPVWVYVKFGILGLLPVCIIFIISSMKLLRSIIRVKYNSELLITNVFGIFFLSFVSAASVTNFLSSFTGAVAASLLAVYFLKNKNLSLNN